MNTYNRLAKDFLKQKRQKTIKFEYKLFTRKMSPSLTAHVRSENLMSSL